MDIPRNERGIAIPGREGEFLDPRTLSQTPGGSIYGTTPGGTKIFYARDQLLFLRNSPLAKTPPKIPFIPGVTIGGESAPSTLVDRTPKKAPESPEIKPSTEDEDMFPME